MTQIHHIQLDHGTASLPMPPPSSSPEDEAQGGGTRRWRWRHGSLCDSGSGSETLKKLAAVCGAGRELRRGGMKILHLSGGHIHSSVNQRMYCHVYSSVNRPINIVCYISRFQVPYFPVVMCLQRGEQRAGEVHEVKGGMDLVPLPEG
jgi:hypothetical protein